MRIKWVWVNTVCTTCCVCVCWWKDYKGITFFNCYRLLLLIGGSVTRDDGKNRRRGSGKKNFFDCLMIWKINIKRLTSTLILLPVRPKEKERWSSTKCLKFFFSERITEIIYTKVYRKFPSMAKLFMLFMRLTQFKASTVLQQSSFCCWCCVLLALCENNSEEIN
jgi:hypothetical protein